MVQRNSLQGPFQGTTANLTVFAPINDAFQRRAFVAPFYGCTNMTCLLNSHPEVARGLVAYSTLQQPVTGQQLFNGAVFNTSAAIGLTPITIAVGPPDGSTTIVRPTLPPQPGCCTCPRQRK